MGRQPFGRKTFLCYLDISLDSIKDKESTRFWPSHAVIFFFLVILLDKIGEVLVFRESLIF